MKTKKINFEIKHFYPGFKADKFFDFLVDADWYSKSDLMKGTMKIEKSGKNHPVGLGAIRRTKMDKTEIVEETVGFDYPNYFSYFALEGMPIVDDYLGEVFLKEKDGGLELKYKGSFKPKMFGTNCLVRYMFLFQMKNMVSVWEKDYRAYYKINKSTN